mmetsp:Transcript_18537/g.25615  ORF Transcript_18537/g.25615 Transcript_18537/m.25615 type:complete len:87 (+) Transcript_18537:166-426(+)
MAFTEYPLTLEPTQSLLGKPRNPWFLSRSSTFTLSLSPRPRNSYVCTPHYGHNRMVPGNNSNPTSNLRPRNPHRCNQGFPHCSEEI